MVARLVAYLVLMIVIADEIQTQMFELVWEAGFVCPSV